jgi:hypothetical protein
MPDIKVDPDDFDALARELFRLRDEFAGLRQRVDQYEDFLGHKKLAEELRSTADNWSKKRDKLIARLDELAAMATQAANHYRALDATMAAQIQAAGPAVE